MSNNISVPFTSQSQNAFSFLMDSGGQFNLICFKKIKFYDHLVGYIGL